MAMARCPQCEYPVPDDRQRVGARCPNCHDPLYEPAQRFSRRSREDEASCALHAGMESVSACARCNQHLCETCRTRWRNVIICATCAGKALASGEAAPLTTAAGGRQAIASVCLGGGAWLLAALALLGLRYAGGEGDLSALLAFACFVLALAAVLPAAAGVGQAAAALRGSARRPLAVAGLLLGALYVGAVLGLGTLALWQN